MQNFSSILFEMGEFFFFFFNVGSMNNNIYNLKLFLVFGNFRSLMFSLNTQNTSDHHLAT